MCWSSFYHPLGQRWFGISAPRENVLSPGNIYLGYCTRPVVFLFPNINSYFIPLRFDYCSRHLRFLHASLISLVDANLVCTMSQPPVHGQKPLTAEMQTSEPNRHQRALEATPTQGPTQTLPSLRDTVGKEYNAKREIAPGRPGIRELFIPGVHEFVLDGQPIRIYKIGQDSYMMQQPPHETRSEATRTTIDGRKITYVLDVVQQPDKARACGSGNKCNTVLSLL
jgi:hypothetical protein